MTTHYCQSWLVSKVALYIRKRVLNWKKKKKRAFSSLFDFEWSKINVYSFCCPILKEFHFISYSMDVLYWNTCKNNIEGKEREIHENRWKSSHINVFLRYHWDMENCCLVEMFSRFSNDIYILNGYNHFHHNSVNAYLIFGIFFTHAKFLENKIYT